MTVRGPFNGISGANQLVTAAAATPGSVTLLKESKSVRIVNSGTGLCHVRVGEDAQTATTADIPVLPSSSVVIGKDDVQLTVAYFSTAGTDLHVQPGEGWE